MNLKGDGVHSVAECVLSKHKVLDSIFSTSIRKKTLETIEKCINFKYLQIYKLPLLKLFYRIIRVNEKVPLHDCDPADNCGRKLEYDHMK